MSNYKVYPRMADFEGECSQKLGFRPHWRKCGCSPLGGREVCRVTWSRSCPQPLEPQPLHTGGMRMCIEAVWAQVQVGGLEYPPSILEDHRKAITRPGRACKGTERLWSGCVAGTVHNLKSSHPYQFLKVKHQTQEVVKGSPSSPVTSTEKAHSIHWKEICLK